MDQGRLARASRDLAAAVSRPDGIPGRHGFRALGENRPDLAGTLPHPRGDGRASGFLLPRARGVRSAGDGQVLGRRGAGAICCARQAHRGAGSVRSREPRSALSRPRRRDGAQARRPGAADAARPHRQGRKPADLPGCGDPGEARDDRPAEGGAEAGVGGTMSRLLLARHGQSLSNAVRRFQGHQDVALSDLGLRQAAALGQAIRHRRIAAVYTSPLQRARRTAEIAMEGLEVPVTEVHELRELSLGDWEGMTVEEISRQPGDPYAQWVRDPVTCLPPGAEPLAEVQARVVRAMDAIAAAHPDGQEVLVVCHGGVISAYLAHCLGLPLSSIWRLTLSNGSISEVAPPVVRTVNSTWHLAGLAVGAAFSPSRLGP